MIYKINMIVLLVKFKNSSYLYEETFEMLKISLHPSQTVFFRNMDLKLTRGSMTR